MPDVTSWTPDRRRLGSSSSRMLALAPGLLVTATLAAVDLSIQPSTAIIGIVAVAPLVTALVGAPRDVAIVGALRGLLIPAR